MTQEPPEPFEVLCPCCQAKLRVDPELRAVLSHELPPEERSVKTLTEAMKGLKAEAAQRQARFEESLKLRRARRICWTRSSRTRSSGQRTFLSASRSGISTWTDGGVRCATRRVGHSDAPLATGCARTACSPGAPFTERMIRCPLPHDELQEGITLMTDPSSPLRLHDVPSDWRRPVLVVAFSGWNDAAESATAAARVLSPDLAVEAPGRDRAGGVLPFRPHPAGSPIPAGRLGAPGRPLADDRLRSER